MDAIIARWQCFLLMVLLQAAMATARADVAVEDDAGRTVALPQPAARIVSLAPHVTELLFSAGAGDKVVGVVSYSDYPQAARDIGEIGSYKQFDFEQIVALQPDLIVGWESGNPASAVEQLRHLGLTVYLTEPRTLEDIATNVERLAQLAGTGKAARGPVAEFRAGVTSLRKQYRNAETVSLFYEAWNDPLMTLNGDHLFSRVAEVCGGRNVFARLPALAPRISTEAVLEKDPQVIVASGMNEKRPDWLDDWARWPSLRAVKRDQLYFVPPDIIQRSSLRILQGAEQLCDILANARQVYTTGD